MNDVFFLNLKLSLAMMMRATVFCFLTVLLYVACAEVINPDRYGTCGDHIEWDFFEGNHSLMISGSGDMYDYSFKSSPWYDFRELIHTVVIAGSVNNIGIDAFYDCWNMNSISISPSVYTIGSKAFFKCKSLVTVELSSNIYSVNLHAFGRCSSLTNITVDPENTRYKSIDGVLFDKTGATLVQYPCSKGTTYSVPDGVTTIDDGAFAECNPLTSVSLPSTVTNMDADSFQGCDNLLEILVNESNPTYKTIDGVVFNSTGTTLISFPCGKTDKFSIPGSVTSIKSHAFSGCSKVKSITIPSSTSTIERFSFYMCSNLKEILVDSGNSVFKSIDGLLVDITGEKLVHYPCGKSEHAIIPRGISTLLEGSIVECNDITDFTISETVVTIEAFAFNVLEKLSSVTYLGDSPPDCSATNTFVFCDALLNACIPINYNSQVFCGVTAYSQSPSFEQIRGLNNECNQVFVCSETNYTVQKRENATDWEGQSNECFEYRCDPAYGPVRNNQCNNSDGINRVCTTDNKCEERESFRQEWIVVIELNSTNFDEMNSTELIETISNISGVDPDTIKIGVEMDDHGKIVRIIVFVSNQQTAEAIIKAINAMEEDECQNGIICRSKEARVISPERLLSNAIHCQPILAIPFGLMVMISTLLISN